MARIGFKQAKYNKIVDGAYAAISDNKIPVFEKVVDEAFAPEYNTAELYANDALVETDYSFNKGTLTLTIADDDDEFVAELLGSTVETEGSEVTQTISDTAPEIGYGHVIPKMVGGVRKYKVEFFPRVKFTKITSDNKSRGASLEFSTSSIEGTVFPLESELNGVVAGVWEKHQTFATLQEAETYLDDLLTPTA